MLEVNSGWQKKLEISSPAKEVMDFVNIKKVSFRYNNLLKENHMWEQDNILKKVLEIATKYDLYVRHVKKYEYINLCLHSVNGNVMVQYHKTVYGNRGNVLVIGDAKENYPNSKSLKKLSDYEILSGDAGRNKLWLRAEGKTFGHRKPAQLFLLPDNVNDLKEWKEVEQLIAYASNKGNTDWIMNKSVIITHGDVDGMLGCQWSERR